MAVGVHVCVRVCKCMYVCMHVCIGPPHLINCIVFFFIISMCIFFDI